MMELADGFGSIRRPPPPAQSLSRTHFRRKKNSTPSTEDICNSARSHPAVWEAKRSSTSKRGTAG